jgi:DNA-binding CsgD family transcriptional regulator
MPLSARLGTARAVGMTRHVTGLLEAGDARIQTLRRACEELARSQSRLEYAAALCDYGAALRRASHRAEARAPLREALEIARDARAEPLRDRAAEELKAAGARVSRPHATGAEALTAAERRIASMAATGTSNREIAQALFVTVKTVETHLGRAYQKLNLTGRGQLAAALGRDVPSTARTLDGRLAAQSPG